MRYGILVFLLTFQTQALAGFDCSVFVDGNPSSNLPVAAKPSGFWKVTRMAWPGNWRIFRRSRSREIVRSPPLLEQHEIDRATVIAKIQEPLERDPDYVTFRVIPALKEIIGKHALPNEITFERDYEVVILRAQGEIPFEVYAAVPIYSPLPFLEFTPSSHGKLEFPMQSTARQVFFFHPFKFGELESLRREERDLEEAVKFEFHTSMGTISANNFSGAEAAERVFPIYSRNAAFQLPEESIRGDSFHANHRFDFTNLEYARTDDLVEFSHTEYGPSSNMIHGLIAARQHAFWKPEMTFEVIPIYSDKAPFELLKMETWEGTHEFPLGKREWTGGLTGVQREYDARGGVRSDKGLFIQVTPVSKSEVAQLATTTVDLGFLRLKGVVLDSLQVKTGYTLDEGFFKSYPNHGFDLFRFENNSGDYKYFFISHSRGEARTYDGKLGYGPVSFLDFQGSVARLEISPGEFLVLTRGNHDSNNVSLYFGNEVDLLKHIHTRVQNFEAEGGYENWKASRIIDSSQGEITQRYSEILENSLETLLVRDSITPSEVATTVRVLREAINRLNNLISEFEIVSSEKEVIQLLRGIHHKSEGQKLENLREIIEELRNFLDYRDFLIRQIIDVYRNIEGTLTPRYEDLRDAVTTKSDPVLAETEVGAFESGVGFFLFGNGQNSPVQVHLLAAGQHLARNQKFLSLLQMYETALAARQEKLDENTRIEIWENLVQIMNLQGQFE